MKRSAPYRLSRRAWLTGSAAILSSVPFAVASADSTPPNRTAQKLAELSQWVEKRKGSLSALFVDLQNGNTIASTAPARSLNPASTMKLVTAAVALDLLGAGFRFQTGVYGEIERGVVPTLVLRGNGDPSLTEAGLWRLANAVAALGVQRVGNLVVDPTRFDEQFVPPAFDQQPNEWASFRAPVSAIAVERNTVTLNVLPTSPGQPARVWFQPAGAVNISGQIATKPRGGGQNIQLELVPQGSAALVGKVSGHVAEGLPRQRFTKRVDDPRLLSGLVLRALLESEGVKVGEVSSGPAAEKHRLTFHGSEPLQVLIAEMGKYSDNFTAEMIFKALPSNVEAGPLTFARAAEVTSGWLRQHGAYVEGTVIKNGSGLFDANRLSAAALTKVLDVAYQSPRLRNEYLSHLSIGGVDGTLRSRFRQAAEQRRVRAKTGTLAAVTALSGYVMKPTSAAPYAFAVLVNDIAGQHGEIRQRIDQVVATLL